MALALDHPSTVRRQPGILSRAAATWALWRRRRRERVELARLGERELRDIGVTPADVAAELEKPFWRK